MHDKTWYEEKSTWIDDDEMRINLRNMGKYDAPVLQYEDNCVSILEYWRLHSSQVPILINYEDILLTPHSLMTILYKRISDDLNYLVNQINIIDCFKSIIRSYIINTYNKLLINKHRLLSCLILCMSDINEYINDLIANNINYRISTASIIIVVDNDTKLKLIDILINILEKYNQIY